MQRPLVFAAVLLAVGAAFGGETEGTDQKEIAKAVAVTYLDSWQFKDYEEMYLLLVEEESKKFKEAEFAEKLGRATFVPVSAEISSLIHRGESAKVRVTLEDAGGLVKKETLRLRKEGAEWRVVPLYLELPVIARVAGSTLAVAAPELDKRVPDIPDLGLDEILDRLSERGEEVADLTARIKYQAPVMGVNMGMTGDMMYKRPNKFRLDFTTPAAMTMTSDGNRLWIVAERLGYVADVRDMQEQENVILGLGDSVKAMRRDYEVSLVGRELVEDKPTYRLALKSRKKDSPIASAELWIDADLWVPVKNVAEASTGIKVELILKDVNINVGLGDDLFTYEGKPGVDMLPLDLSFFGG